MFPKLERNIKKLKKYDIFITKYFFILVIKELFYEPELYFFDKISYILFVFTNFKNVIL